MANSKSIYVIHATDADQHLGHLKRILDGLKTDSRIEKYGTIDSKSVTAGTFETLRDGDMVIALLSNEIVPDKSAIEELLLSVKTRVPRSRISEILIDNVPYESKFIAFPTDLQPIRAREDMDAVWGNIGNQLRSMFPVQAIPEEVSWRQKYKKYIFYVLGVILALILLLFIIQKCARSSDDIPRTGEGVEAEEVINIGEIEVRVEPANKVSQNCPEKITFIGRFKASGQAKVQYRWITDAGRIVKTGTYQIPANGKGEIIETESIGKPGKNLDGWVRLEIIKPISVKSDKASYKLKCAAATSKLKLLPDVQNMGGTNGVSGSLLSKAGTRAFSPPSFGDNGPGVGRRGFLTFDLREIPRDAEILSAELYCDKGGQSGNPAVFQNILIERVDIGSALEYSDYKRNGSLLKEVTVGQLVRNNPIDITEAIKLAIRNNQKRLTLRFRPSWANNNDNNKDVWAFGYSSGITRLEISFN